MIARAIVLESVLVEEHWLRRGPEAFAAEKHLMGDLDRLDTPSKRVRIPTDAPERTVAWLEGIRAEDPDEPLWAGVESLTAEAGAAVVQFRDGVDPALRAAGDAQVACVLYPEGETSEVGPIG